MELHAFSIIKRVLWCQGDSQQLQWVRYLTSWTCCIGYFSRIIFWKAEIYLSWYFCLSLFSTFKQTYYCSHRTGRKEGSQHLAASSDDWVSNTQANKGADQDFGKDKIVKKEILQPSLFFSFEVRKWWSGLHIVWGVEICSPGEN